MKSELTSSSGVRLILVTSGSFIMGSPPDEVGHEVWEREREVTLPYAQAGPPCIYDAIHANDFDLALRIVAADPLAVESPDVIPPPLHYCSDLDANGAHEDKPEWIEWLLDHGADIERLEQDYGSTPLDCAVIRRQKRSIRTLVKRGADATRAMDCAQRGLAGAYEDDPSLDREGYREIIELLRELGIG